ncbi:hypothetical protein GOV05_04925 [Candidatus Woesearchaeota archaeon]|nr:hypothetical protein [Candidatus Woesearchaeota archaeon]
MKILAAGDLHGDSIAAHKLARKALKEKVDLVILSGDLTNNDEDYENILGEFKKVNKKVLFIPGNHDSFSTADFLEDAYEFKNIHKKGVRYNDIGFFGCGGSNIGLFRLSEKDIFDYLDASHKKVAYLPRKVMVTHNHPTGTLMERFSDFVKGSSGVREAVLKLKPDFLICSHVHEAEGIEEKIGKTKVLNVGKKGKVIEL